MLGSTHIALEFSELLHERVTDCRGQVIEVLFIRCNLHARQDHGELGDDAVGRLLGLPLYAQYV